MHLKCGDKALQPSGQCHVTYRLLMGYDHPGSRTVGSVTVGKWINASAQQELSRTITRPRH